MGELTSITPKRPYGRWQLLTGVSGLALASLFPMSVAAAQDNDHPTVWIEIGGQLERLGNGQESFTPPFVGDLLDNPFTPPSKAEAPPRYSTGEEGRFSFSPNGSDWTFSAAVRYGRANSTGNVHEQTSPASPVVFASVPVIGLHLQQTHPAAAERFATTASQTHQTHLVLDFQAGKDVGLGVFGLSGSSTFGAGVRFAQFTSRSTDRIDGDPNFTVSYKYSTQFGGNPATIKVPSQAWDIYFAKNSVARSFTGVGPSLAWDGDALLMGHPNTGSVTFDWGLNGALLFGRQKMASHHETSAHYGSGANTNQPLPQVYQTAHDPARSRSVVIPNVGGFAGLSLRFPNAKVSLGYRIDAFFGAMDGSIDARKTYDRDFYGPFAAIAVGL